MRKQNPRDLTGAEERDHEMTRVPGLNAPDSTSDLIVIGPDETGAPILPAVIIRQGNTGRHRLRIEPEFVLETPHADLDDNIRHNTERLNRIIEGWIREAPEQWLWAHRRWKVQDDPSGWHIPESLQRLIPAPKGS